MHKMICSIRIKNLEMQRLIYKVNGMKWSRISMLLSKRKQGKWQGMALQILNFWSIMMFLLLTVMYITGESVTLAQQEGYVISTDVKFACQVNYVTSMIKRKYFSMMK